MTYAFTFDASACSGCKACQEACKDKNNLPVGVLWRRVVEVSGGEWENVGARSPRPEINDANGVGESDWVRRPDPYTVWTNTVFAYNLSIACNHCEHPKCAGVCPTDAYIHRKDGIVYIDPNKCMGCGYCAWACPYNAPRYNFELGQMTKCNFCFDNIDAGLPPSCVAACPMRVLNFVEVNSNQLSVISGRFSELWKIPAAEHPFPLPETSRTEPHLAVKPHAAMGNALEKKISNYEEIRPKPEKSETPLVTFTLLAQMAVGAFWALQWMGLGLTWEQRILPLLSVGLCLALAGWFSFAHLGAKRNAWRALAGLQKSWLSREVLYVGLFGAGWIVSLLPLPKVDSALMGAATSIVGAGLLYSMAQVYRLPSMPAWSTWRTPMGFFLTALLLGPLLAWIVLRSAGVSTPFAPMGWLVAALLVAQAALALSARETAPRRGDRLRFGLIGVGILEAGLLAWEAGPRAAWMCIPLLLTVLLEEALGRRRFYAALEERRL